MFRYKLRTLVIAGALLPPILAGLYWAMTIYTVPAFLLAWTAASILAVVLGWREFRVL
jgi:hypothetical protein